MKMKSTLLSFLLSAICSFGLMAQSINTLTITEPASIAGEYTVVTGAFGLDDGVTISGDITLGEDDTDPVNDGCTALVNDLSGTIGMVDRGACNFSLKALNAQNAGAIAVVVCNNVPDAPFVMAAGDVGGDVTVPSVMMSQADCNTLKVELGNGAVTASLSYVMPTCDVNYPADVAWGGNGEGAFAGGLGDWVPSGGLAETDLWTWSDDAASDGCFCAALTGSIIESQSFCDGAALFDGDAYNNINNPECDGAAALLLDHIGNLTSPTMDLSAVDGPVVEFSQILLDLNTAINTLSNGAGLAYSIDDGATWVDTIDITTENVCSASAQNIVGTEYVSTAIPAIAGQANVRLRFIFASDYYFWMIDDVIVRNLDLSDVRAMENWYSKAPNFQTPASQTDNMAFMIDVFNIGTKDVDDINLDVTVTNESGMEVYSDSYSYGTIEGADILTGQNQILPDLYAMPTEEGSYLGSYSLSAPTDEVPDNNTVDFVFQISEGTFSKVLSETDAGQAYLGARSVPNETFESRGNYYYVPNGNGYVVTGTRVGIVIDGGDNSAAANPGFLNVHLYQWLDINGDGACSGDERILIAVNANDMVVGEQTAEELRDMDVPLVSVEGENVDIKLEDDSHYLIMLHTNPLNASTGSTYRVIAAGADVQPNFAYGAMTFALQNGFMINRFGSLNATGSDGSDGDVNGRSFTANGFWAHYAPLFIEPESSATTDLNTSLNVDIFPNPVSEVMIIDVDLDKAYENVSVQLTNITGQTVISDQYKNLQTAELKYDVNALSSGTYMIKVITEDGFITKKVMIQN